MSGKLYTFEGVDGAGKTTIIKEVQKALLKKGVKKRQIILTAEPSDSAFGRKVREMLSSGKNPSEDGEEFLALYVLDRKFHLKKTILPAVFDGKIVLCDRYKYSTLVYQSLQGISPKKIVQMHKGMLVPDAVFVLDLPVEKALERLSNSHRKNSELFEKKPFLAKARKKFLGLKKFFPKEKIIVVDASKPLKETAEKIASIIKKSI